MKYNGTNIRHLDVEKSVFIEKFMYKIIFCVQGHTENFDYNIDYRRKYNTVRQLGNSFDDTGDIFSNKSLIRLPEVSKH